MNLSVPLNISIVVSIYILVLIVVSPMIDHFFDELPTDIQDKDSNLKILSEIIIHIIVLSIVWYLVHIYLSRFLRSYLKVTISSGAQTSLDIITSVALVGLQKNLISKLSYITGEHPFRILDL